MAAGVLDVRYLPDKVETVQKSAHSTKCDTTGRAGDVIRSEVMEGKSQEVTGRRHKRPRKLDRMTNTSYTRQATVYILLRRLKT